jgi:hypothetical protein
MSGMWDKYGKEAEQVLERSRTSIGKKQNKY